MGGLQVWRLITSFLLSGPGLSVLMDPFFLFKYASDCERMKLSRKGDFTVFLLFVGSIIIFLNTFFVHGMTFCSPLILALAYYWSALSAPGIRVNFFIAQFPVKFLPWIMLLMTLVQGGNVLLDLTGIIAGHAYLFLTEIWPEHGGGSNWLKTLGDVVEGWYQIAERAMATPAPPPQGLAPRVAAAPRGSVGVGGAPGASGSNFFGGGSGWSHRGQGHKLGG